MPNWDDPKIQEIGLRIAKDAGYNSLEEVAGLPDEAISLFEKEVDNEVMRLVSPESRPGIAERLLSATKQLGRQTVQHLSQSGEQLTGIPSESGPGGINIPVGAARGALEYLASIPRNIAENYRQAFARVFKGEEPAEEVPSILQTIVPTEALGEFIRNPSPEAAPAAILETVMNVAGGKGVLRGAATKAVEIPSARSALRSAIGEQKKMLRGLEKARLDGNVSPLQYFEMQQKALAPLEEVYDRIIAERGTPPAKIPATKAGTIRNIINEITDDFSTATGVAKSLVGKAEDKIETPIGRDAAKMILDADATGKVITGQLLRKVDEAVNVDLGVGGKARVSGERLQAILEGKSKPINPLEKQATSKLREVLDAMYDMAEGIYGGAKEQLADYRKNYFPIVYEPSVMFSVFHDLNRALLSAKDIATRRGLDTRDVAVLKGILNEKKISDFHWSQNTLDYVKHHKDMFNVDLGSSIARGLEKTRGELQGLFGSLDKGRTLEFPLSFRVKNPMDALIIYVEKFGKRLGELEVFGKDLGHIRGKINEIAKTNPDEAAYVTGLLEDFTGATEFHQSKLIGGTFNAPGYVLRRAFGEFAAYEFLTKIATGFSTVKQVGQTLFSVYPYVGLPNYLRGLSKAALDEKTVNMVKDSGILSSDIYRSVTADVSHSWSRHLGDNVGAHFMAANRVNFFIAAAAWREQLNTWHRLANNAMASARERNGARSTLQDLGFDWQQPFLDEGQTLKAMYRFANDSQLQRNVIRDPRWVTNPWLRPLATFKTFDIRQFNWTRDMLRDALKKDKGELAKRMLQLVIASQVVGEWNTWAVNRLKEAFSGREVYRDDDNRWQRFINNFVNAGTAGWGTTIGGALANMFAGQPAEESVRDAAFTLTPVAVSEAMSAKEQVERFAGDLSVDRGLAESMRRAFGRGAGKIGPGFTALFGQSALTAEQQMEREKREKTEIIQRYLSASPEVRTELLRDYNKNNPNNPILPGDIFNAMRSGVKRTIRREKVQHELVR